MPANEKPANEKSPIEVTAFAWVPPFARGFVRDLRVRWALEEIGLPYRVRLIGGAGGTPFGPPRPENYLVEQPFGQLPVYKEGALCLFESGAIVLHIAERHAGLLPDDASAKARAIAWMFAAKSTVEPPIVDIGAAAREEGDKPWHEARRPILEDRVRERLAQLSRRLGDADWLDDGFTAGDLMMVTVLRRLGSSGLLQEHPNLAAYVARGEARPAHQRAFAAQLAVFNNASSAG